MKKLIKRLSYAICILLLTCTFCHAQIEFNSDSIQEVIKVSYDSTKVKVGGDELLTIKMMVKYEKECYNDSTKFEGAVYELIDGTVFIGSRPKPYEFMTNYVRDTVYYYHKQPTFKDFVRWAANKYGL